MTTKRIIWSNADGSLSVTTPVEVQLDTETEQQYLDRIAAKVQPAGSTRLADQDVSTLPVSRRFRAAWRQVAGNVQAHFITARAQLVAELRAQRDAILAQSDALKAKYDDIGTAGQKLAVFNYRQSLRDLTTQIQSDVSAMTTVAQLEAYVAPIPALPAGITL